MDAKKYFMLLLIAVLMIFGAIAPVSACETNFNDVSPDHWAYQQIYDLTEKGIISGYPDSTFKPENIVSRAEFAKMMVLALKLPVNKTNVPTFKDIPGNSWSFPYVETAKFYLTGFRTSNGDYFKPGSPAVREDMAVALVKALGYENESVNENLTFADSNLISPNLKRYVAIAVKHNLMQGDSKENGTMRLFRPQDSLKRSEAAVLLSKIQTGGASEEKVTYDTESVTPAPPDQEVSASEYPAPLVTADVADNKIVLKWQPIYDSRLQGYKVVISKHNPNPKYPEDGYLYWITDKNRTYAVIDNHESYNNGDFGSHLTPGEEYYFSVTAVYGDRKVGGNTITLTFPD